MSKNSKANRNRRAAKAARHAKRRRSTGRSGSRSSMAGFFADDELLTVSVIRSRSGRRYAEEESIPIPDREVVAVVDDVEPQDAERIGHLRPRRCARSTALQMAGDKCFA